MTSRVAAVTGASGYLGSRICATLESQGWQVVSLARSPGHPTGRFCSYDLSSPVSAEVAAVLRSADLLVHAAYDLTLTNHSDIRRVNIDGTKRLLDAASVAGVGRILVLSSMSAYSGTTQLYGRAKLEIESATAVIGGCAVRPGLVYGSQPGGMAAALRKMSKLPVVPVIAGGAALYTVLDDDLMAAIGRLANAEGPLPGIISVADPTPVSFRDIMATFAGAEGRHCRFLPIPWQPIYAVLRLAELLRLRLPFRADSLLGLVRSAPEVMNGDTVATLGVAVHSFADARC
jgi:nucleoside-diphosphate-sugar epimerase